MTTNDLVWFTGRTAGGDRLSLAHQSQFYAPHTIIGGHHPAVVALCGTYVDDPVVATARVNNGVREKCTICEVDGEAYTARWQQDNEAAASRVRDASHGKQRTADIRRAAALAIITEVLDTTDRQAEEEGEPPDLLQYLDDVARHLLTIVEDPS